jgi:hypothetical protein
MRNFLSARLLRTVKVTSAQWQRRTLFLIGGITVGAAAVGLALAADWVQAEFHLLIVRWRYASLVVTPLGFALSPVRRRVSPLPSTRLSPASCSASRR